MLRRLRGREEQRGESHIHRGIVLERGVGEDGEGGGRGCSGQGSLRAGGDAEVEDVRGEEGAVRRLGGRGAGGGEAGGVRVGGGASPGDELRQREEARGHPAFLARHRHRRLLPGLLPQNPRALRRRRRPIRRHPRLAQRLQLLPERLPRPAHGLLQTRAQHSPHRPHQYRLPLRRLHRTNHVPRRPHLRHPRLTPPHQNLPPRHPRRQNPPRHRLPVLPPQLPNGPDPQRPRRRYRNQPLPRLHPLRRTRQEPRPGDRGVRGAGGGERREDRR
mmetsp:Transcript_28882/g.72529  ORF Transcript_28882/g.72529 Transcript_28882/m.72529 type:complete len:274 (+) Transcript_28882:356-1177(+)